MKNKYLLLLVLTLLSVNIVSASIGNLGTFKVNSCINLLQTCADCTYNNISSVTQPDGIKGIGQVAMTKLGTEYTYSFCNTTKAGTYNVNGFGDATGALTKWNYNFKVTPTGAEDNTLFFIIIILIATGLILLGFIFKNYIFAFFGGLTFLICGVYGMIYGYGDVTTNFTRMVSYILIGLGGLITILSGLDLLKSVEGKEDNAEDFD
jgi:hypothetical protein